MLEDFTQSINHPSLNHQLQAKGVTSIEAALREGEAYLQAQRLYKTHHRRTRLQERAPATTANTSLESATDRLMTMMTWVMAALSSIRPTATSPRAPRRTNGNWREDRQGHPRPDPRKPRRPPRPRKPGKKRMQGGPRRASVRTPQQNPHGWQTPRRTSRPERQREPFTLSLTNRFSQLPETELAGEVHPDIGGELNTPLPERPYLLRPRKPPKKRAPPRVAKSEQAGEVRVHPHGDSYFLPGKVTGRDVTFLLDSGCTTNLLSRRVFNTLPLKERRGLAPYTGKPGTLADGSSIPFDGVLKLTGRVRDQAIQEIFVISPLEEDAILGMPFLKRHGCRIDFSKSAVLMAERELTCIDKSGRPLAGSVQAVRKCTVPGRSRATIHCRVNDSQLSGLGVVEGAHTRIQLASSLNRLTDRGEILVQCQPFLRGSNHTIRVHARPFPLHTGERCPAVAGRSDGRSPPEPVLEAGDRPATRPRLVPHSL